jgi:hypothetical protein
MREPIEEWLERINQQFSKNNIDHRQRPWLAWQEWARHTGLSFSHTDDDVRKIFAWFEKNTKAGSQYVGSLYTGTFLYDACFWPVFLPVVFGTVMLNAGDSLKTMPETIKRRLCQDPGQSMQYACHWADCADYAFGINGVIKRSNANAFAQELYKSGDQQLDATVTLLLAERPNPRAGESARMATEMLLKAFLASRSGLTKKDAMKIRHDIGEAQERTGFLPEWMDSRR